MYGMEHSNYRRDGYYCNTRCLTLLYAMFVTLFSTILFLYGFFPLKLHNEGIATMQDIPTHVEHVRVNTELLYKPVIKKLVVMIIDGLRWDFVTGPIGEISMPITRKLIESNAACLLQTKTGSPTVTMPRIKAITTGSVPTFIDVVLNFGSNKILGDSLLLQAKNHGHKLIFHGDDTWLKLFPDIFHRSDGTTSFFVTDYTEVDNNVTRHIDKELKEMDWSVMVLHYLGLDHIGHTGGPKSPLIKPKLKEMDDIIGKINVAVQRWQSANEQTLFIICGDHGMRDSGGHGGNTPQETLVPFVAIGVSCSKNNNEVLEMAQVDITSTIAVLLGIPIPSSNLGSISLHLLSQLSTSSKLFSLYYNAKQVFYHFKQLTDFTSTRAYENYMNAMKLHSVWLEASGSTTETVDEIIYMYGVALRGMKDEFTSSMSNYDISVMTIAIFFLFHALYIMMNTELEAKTMSRNIINFFFINVILFWVLVNYIWQGVSQSLLSSNDVIGNLLITLIAIMSFGNCYFFTKGKLSISYIKKQLAKGRATQCLMLLGTLIHALSFGSTSFVEEEHRTWYFFWTTFCLLLLYHIVSSLIAQSSPKDQQTHTEGFRFSCRYWDSSYRIKISLQIFLCLLAHAILRYLNSTGDVYAHLPDIADWLQHQDSKIGMTITLVLALFCLICIGYSYEETRYRKYYLVLYVSLAMCVYLRNMATEAVVRLPFYPVSRGIYEVHVFWNLLTVFWIVGLLRLVTTIKRDRKRFLTLLLRFIVECWVMVSAMLHRPYNVGLIPIQLLFSIVIYAALKSDQKRDITVEVHYWLGNVFYFYQGNSNNLSTIDVAAGYVGMESYNPYVTGFFLAVNVYSAPVLAYLTLAYTVVSESETKKSRDDIIEINRRYAICKLMPLAVYAIIITINRYHLFIWTVFSPKLLYEAMYCTVIYIVIFTITITSVIHDKINQY